jgi:hypothetical protein
MNKARAGAQKAADLHPERGLQTAAAATGAHLSPDDQNLNGAD